MGLGVTVGILADLIKNDPEGADWVRDELRATSNALLEFNLAQHVEPTDCPVWSASSYGYSGLHALREVAGYVWAGSDIPRTKIDGTGGTPMEDALFEACLNFMQSEPPEPKGMLERLMSKNTEPKPPSFIHLIAHSDAQGYYMPIDFAVPVTPSIIDDDTAHLWPVGSAPSLAREVDQLCAALGMPKTLTHQSGEVQEALVTTVASSEPLWRIQSVATYTALLLRDACVASKQSGAVIAFG